MGMIVVMMRVVLMVMVWMIEMVVMTRSVRIVRRSKLVPIVMVQKLLLQLLLSLLVNLPLPLANHLIHRWCQLIVGIGDGMLVML